jgi:Transposase DDE domain
LTNLSEHVAITDSETLDEVMNCLSKHLNIPTQGAYDRDYLLKILVKAASMGDTIENTIKSLKEVSSSNTIRYHLNKLNDFDDLEKSLNSALKSLLLPQGKKTRLRLAVDFNLIPYYGEPSVDELPYIYRSQAKLGTCSFYAYATLCIIDNNKRFTVAIRAVRKEETIVAILTYLLAELDGYNLQINKLYLDRGFFTVAVIRWLQALDIPFSMPAIRRGKKGGINQFLVGRKSYKTTYTMTSKQGDSVTLELAIICKYRKGKRKKKGIEYLVYVIHKLTTSLNHIHQDYRKRFGIETSYRLKNVCRIRTTSKNPIARLLFVGISFVLVNIWINLLWRKVSQPRQGSRLIYRSFFPLKQMLSFLSQVIDKQFKLVEGIYIPSG